MDTLFDNDNPSKIFTKWNKNLKPAQLNKLLLSTVWKLLEKGNFYRGSCHVFWGRYKSSWGVHTHVCVTLRWATCSGQPARSEADHPRCPEVPLSIPNILGHTVGDLVLQAATYGILLLFILLCCLRVGGLLLPCCLIAIFEFVFAFSTCGWKLRSTLEVMQHVRWFRFSITL